MSKLTVTYTLRCEPETDIPYVGNCSAVDPETDRETEGWIRDQLNAGNEWAWCTAVVTASIHIDGFGFSDEAILGCCSYESECSFREGLYYADMCEEALANLKLSLARLAERGLSAHKAVLLLEAPE